MSTHSLAFDSPSANTLWTAEYDVDSEGFLKHLYRAGGPRLTALPVKTRPLKDRCYNPDNQRRPLAEPGKSWKNVKSPKRPILNYWKEKMTPLIIQLRPTIMKGRSLFQPSCFASNIARHQNHQDGERQPNEYIQKLPLHSCQDIQLN